MQLAWSSTVHKIEQADVYCGDGLKSSESEWGYRPKH